MAVKTTPTKTAAKPASKAKPAPASAKPPAAKSVPSKPAPSKPAPSKPAPVATVTLKHLAAGLTERHDLPKKQADTLLADLFGTLVDHLKAGERVKIGGLGIIEVKDRPARMGRNPATGAAIEIKASKKVAFRAAKELKEAI